MKGAALNLKRKTNANFKYRLNSMYYAKYLSSAMPTELPPPENCAAFLSACQSQLCKFLPVGNAAEAHRKGDQRSGSLPQRPLCKRRVPPKSLAQLKTIFYIQHEYLSCAGWNAPVDLRRSDALNSPVFAANCSLGRFCIQHPNKNDIRLSVGISEKRHKEKAGGIHSIAEASIRTCGGPF
ncbi:hypothetical protein C4K03_2459 [Pseudomonas synxantha]|uniref:Uncharacterized protein n=1 Tax=Pseudomonas synxantha TaxID=47883 RepID=A0A3G7U5E9_9PSED|nr:hypothetical protein [Pseudomonas synxantha]AZE54614.1 hypothetical protein C4K03_2459 [Pseudomonas synxantha]